MKARLPAFLGLILLGTLLSSVLILFEAGRNLPPTAAPLFELLGKPLKTADAALTRILPIDEVDEEPENDPVIWSRPAIQFDIFFSQTNFFINSTKSALVIVYFLNNLEKLIFKSSKLIVECLS